MTPPRPRRRPRSASSLQLWCQDGPDSSGSAPTARARSTRSEWRDEAACRDLDVAWFYPDPDDNLAVARAQAFCASCPVRRDCARHAIEHNERHGIWGGSTERERAVFRRAMAAAP